MRQQQARRAAAGLLLLGAAALCACNDRALAPLAEAVDGEVVVTDGAALQSRVDILWVVDNSGSMCEEQADLRANFGRFARQLQERGLDFQMAVITTDMMNPAQSGRFQNVPDGAQGPSCQISVDISQCPTAQGGEPAPLIIRSADPRYRLADGGLDTDKLARDFGCSATVGTSGSGFEMGLEAMRAALDVSLRTTDNAGFLRDDAALAVIFVTDENDCSGLTDATNGNDCEWSADRLTSLDRYEDFLLGLKGGDASRIRLGAILAPDTGVRYAPGQSVNPSCLSANGDAYAGWRYEELFARFPTTSTANICAPPFDDALEALGRSLLPDGSLCLPVAQDAQNRAVEVQLVRPDGPLPGQDCEAAAEGWICTLSEDAYTITATAACPGGEVMLGLSRGAGDGLRVRYAQELARTR
jgi:hypothetical protein